ncbi:MAG: hypothetical protein JWP97_5402 [Labilithrix sp.]|nr:hypothetical protein [Labilithrix sp.]
MASALETNADTAITSAGVAAAARTFAGVLNTAKASYTASNGSGQQSHQIFLDRLNAAMLAAGLPAFHGVGGV